MISEQEYLTVPEVADILRCSVEKVRGMCRNKVIGSTKPRGARSYLIPRLSIDEYLKIRR